MNAAPQPLLLDSAGRGLFAVFHATRQPPVAGVLICPPFLHEHARSYRLFALLGDALAAQGLAVMRFDYHGTGDSAGADAAFSLAGADIDGAIALQALRDRIGDAPINIMGVRAGAFPALSLATTHDVRALWLWQPVVEGATYLVELRQLDRVQRESQDSCSQDGSWPASAEDNTLVGFPCSAELFAQLEQARITSSPRIAARVTVLDIETQASMFDDAGRLDLASVHGDWAVEVDIGHFLAAPVRELAARLAALTELP